MSLHEELTRGASPACKLCAYLQTLGPFAEAEWNRELALPTSVVSHASVVTALAHREVDVTEASVRRHRRNHVQR